MDIEELRSFCLSLSPDVTEKFPFVKFKTAKDILVFYIGGHIFCYFDINDLSRVTVRCRSQKEVMELTEEYMSLGKPYNGNAKYWIGIDALKADEQLIKKLIAESFATIKEKSQRYTHKLTNS